MRNLAGLVLTGCILCLWSILPATAAGVAGGDRPSKSEKPPKDSWEFDFSVENRYFLYEPLLIDQQENYVSAAVNARFVRSWRRGREKVVFQPFYRYDAEDEERSHFDLREFYYLDSHRDYEYSLGVRKIFWGVTESQHLVDIINQTDAVENIDGEDKLGQPMLQLGLFSNDWGTLNVYALVGFRERTFAGREGRLRLIPKVSNDDATFESGAEHLRIDGAIRWTISAGDWDIGLSHFSGTSREPNYNLALDPNFAIPAALAELLPDDALNNIPALLPDTLPDNFFEQPSIPLEILDRAVVLVPEYRVIDQTGLDINGIVGSWIFKLEAITRSGQGEISGDTTNFSYDTSKRYYASVGGTEYTLYQIFGTDADLGLIAEYNYDSRGENALTLFEDDVFVGGRLALNDVQGTSVLFGTLYDLDQHELFYSIEASRRITDSLVLNIEGRWFSNVNQANYPLNVFDNDDYIQTEVVYYF